MNSYRLRLIRFDRPETQTVTIRSANEAQARAQVLARLGQGWRITSAELARLP